jgi:translation initiation factor 1 (eIF-1/SUI1)
MDLNQIVEAAVAKALADYISTRGSLDDAFLDKLAKKIAMETIAAQGDLRREIEQEAEKKYRSMFEHMSKMQASMDRYKYGVPPPPWVDKTF